MAALEAAEQSSLTALQANQLGYQVGVRINIDVLNAQSQLYQTRRDLARARYDVLVGLLRLKQASGTLSADDLTPIEQLLASSDTPRTTGAAGEGVKLGSPAGPVAPASATASAPLSAGKPQGERSKGEALAPKPRADRR